MTSACVEPEAVVGGGAARSIAQWLITGPAQVPSGPAAGGIAGVVDADGGALYVYPEITGYYLQWLAWRAARHGRSPELSTRAAAAQTWLRRWLEEDPPRTRIELNGPSDDWRNRAVFYFDLAMVLRGVASAARLQLIDADRAVISGVTRQLRRLIAADGVFDACVAHESATTLPQRWSTSRGGFLAKAAAGILTAASSLPGIDDTIREGAEKSYADSLRRAVESPHDEVHPLLYTFEGVLSLPQHARFDSVVPSLAAQFDSLLADARAHGRIPELRREGTGATGPERLDVLAQTIRVGYLLQAYRPQQPPDRNALARLREILTQHVHRDGAVPFAIESQRGQYNVWAAMFADQALGFAALLDDPRSTADFASLLA